MEEISILFFCGQRNCQQLLVTANAAALDSACNPNTQKNNKAEKSFRLRLSKEKLVSEAQLQVQASIGDRYWPGT